MGKWILPVVPSVITLAGLSIFNCIDVCPLTMRQFSCQVLLCITKGAFKKIKAILDISNTSNWLSMFSMSYMSKCGSKHLGEQLKRKGHTQSKREQIKLAESCSTTCCWAGTTERRRTAGARIKRKAATSRDAARARKENSLSPLLPASELAPVVQPGTCALQVSSSSFTQLNGEGYM